MKALKQLLTVLVLLAGASAARAADLSEAVMLAATERLSGSGYQEAVLVAAPLPQGGHVGFIVNRPTEVKMEDLFPDHEGSRKVVDPVYLGGPTMSEVIFAVTRQVPQGAQQTIALMPGLTAVVDGESVDRVIETTPNEARYFAGLVYWRPGELDYEVNAGAWEVKPASVDAVLGAHPAAQRKSPGVST